MPFYRDINKTTAEGRRTLDRLIKLRALIGEQIPERSFDKNLLLATWNIRDFDKPAYGARLEESIYYIAEIIAAFDLVAVQEVYEDLTGLNRVMRVLGSHWKFIFTDVSGGSRGNSERMAFLYDSRKVRFAGLAGELVLPGEKGSDGHVAAEQVWRTPFICGFKAGWTDFMLATVHIQWGSSSANSPERIKEIERVAQALKARTEDPNAWSRNLVLLGDFNIFKPTNRSFKELTDAGFEIPKQLQKLPSNANRVRHYDQIAFRSRPGRLVLTGRAGVFDFYQTVFRDSDEDRAVYHADMMPSIERKKDGEPRAPSAQKTYYKTYWRTHQMSDHLPMWVELRIDHSEEYLQRKLNTSGN